MAKYDEVKSFKIYKYTYNEIAFVIDLRYHTYISVFIKKNTIKDTHFWDAVQLCLKLIPLN